MAIDSKRCSKCKCIKSIENFNKNKAKKDGYRAYCRGCDSEYYSNNKERINKRNMENHVKNREIRLEQNKERYEKNKNKDLIKARIAQEEFSKLNITHKTCVTCKELKILINFNIDKSKKDGLNIQCKECRKNARTRDHDKIKEKRKRYTEENAEQIRARDNQRYALNTNGDRDKVKAYGKKRYLENKETILENNKLRRKKIVESGMCRAHHNIAAFRKGNCFDCVLLNALRNSHYRTICLIKKGDKKTRSLLAAGCSVGDFKTYIEEQFKEGMNWNNYGEWHIDHIVPLATARTYQEAVKLCHYSNLQPLWKEDNIKKNSWYKGELIRKNKWPLEDDSNNG